MAVSKFIKNNAFIIIGIALPLLVVVFLLLASSIPKWLVEAPQYDFLFTVDSNQARTSTVRVEFQVYKDHLKAKAYKQDLPNYNRLSRLFIFEHESLSIREIPVDIPEEVEEIKNGTEITITEFANQKLSSLRRAPDGYEFKSPYRSGYGFFGGLFYGGRYGQRAAIAKSGRVVAVEYPDSYGYSYGAVKFLGWIIE